MRYGAVKLNHNVKDFWMIDKCPLIAVNNLDNEVLALICFLDILRIIGKNLTLAGISQDIYELLMEKQKDNCDNIREEK